MRRAAVIAALVAGCIEGAPVGDLPPAPPSDAAPDPDVELLGACGLPLTCPAPSSPELATVCGQLYDVRTQAPLRSPSAEGVMCDPMNPSADGPCSVCINAYAPASLVDAPGDAVPLHSEAIELDDCGRFRMIDVAPPTDASVALLAGNCNPVANAWAPTAVSLLTSPQMRVPDQRLFASERALDAEWTASAGAPFGTDTYVDRGAVLETFVHGEAPRAGVTLTVNGRPVPNATYYFSEADDGTLSRIDTARTETGVTGSALVVGTDFVLHGGSGAEPFGCVWPAQLAASIPGVLFVQHKSAVSAPTGDQCHQPGISGNLR